MIKFCNCKTGSNITKSNGNTRISSIYPNSQAIQFQDKAYNKGYRIHTPLSGSKGFKYRCTVCGRET